jgi:magnesium chelatase family protein
VNDPDGHTLKSATEKSLTRTRAQAGMDTPAVTVETHLPGGLPAFTLVGLPETAVRESRDRVKSAIDNCGLSFPNGKVVVNLAPADLAKEGARLDLAIAVSILAATGQLPHRVLEGFEFLGELGLSGELRPIRGCLCAALASGTEVHERRLVLPSANAGELAMAPPGRVVPLAHLREVVRLLREPGYRPAAAPSAKPAANAERESRSLAEVIGQPGAKRALAVAAAGGHHLLMTGPPGTGKTMLARRLAGLLPALTEAEAREAALVYSAAGLPLEYPFVPPFRDPHHTASGPALVGGGGHPQPGEISLAHRGVLFLDELPLFKPSVLEVLREPLETRSITIARARYRARFPASFQLVAAMNPCPAGRVCSESACRCTPEQVRRYRARISGPLLDRIDLHVAVPPIPKALLLAGARDSSSGVDQTKAAIAGARRVQLSRQGRLNVDLTGADATRLTRLNTESRRLLANAVDRFQLSARGFHRVLKVARTVADIEGHVDVGPPHVAEALSYRSVTWEGE